MYVVVRLSSTGLFIVWFTCLLSSLFGRLTKIGELQFLHSHITVFPPHPLKNYVCLLYSSFNIQPLACPVPILWVELQEVQPEISLNLFPPFCLSIPQPGFLSNLWEKRICERACVDVKQGTGETQVQVSTAPSSSLATSQLVARIRWGWGEI